VRSPPRFHGEWRPASPYCAPDEREDEDETRKNPEPRPGGRRPPTAGSIAAYLYATLSCIRLADGSRDVSRASHQVGRPWKRSRPDDVSVISARESETSGDGIVAAPAASPWIVRDSLNGRRAEKVRHGVRAGSGADGFIEQATTRRCVWDRNAKPEIRRRLRIGRPESGAKDAGRQ